jgi:uncharacterized membrane protein YeaQ/YmgE (transglycosylase-associated protein family)
VNVSIIGWLVLGLVAGALARLLVPGRDPMGWLGTMLLGLAGSLVGGFLADLLFDDEAIGLFGSVVGAVLVLLAYNAWARGRDRGLARS